MVDWSSIVADMAPPQPDTPAQASPSPASPTAPAGPASPAPSSPAPSSSQPDWGSVIDDMTADHQAAAAGLTYSAKDANPDTAARALTLSQQTGIPPSVVEQNLPQVEQRTQTLRNNAILQSNPAIARWLIANPDAARVARDDYDNLDFLSKAAANLSAGWTGGQLQNERGNIGNAMQLGLDTPEQQARLGQIDQQLQQQSASTPGGLQGFLRQGAGFASSMFDNLLVGASTGVATAGIGAAEGAAGGAAAGGVGAGPGAAVGGAAGFAYGLGTGTLVDMARVQAGNTYADLSKLRDQNGQPIDEAAKQGAAMLAGVGTYVLGGVGAGAVGRGMGSLFRSAVMEAATRPTVARALGTFATETAKAGATGAVVNGGMELSNIFAEQAAKMLSSGNFPTVFNDETERQNAVNSLVSSMVDGAALLGAFHALPGAVGLTRDTLRARAATDQVQAFQNLEQGAVGSKLRTRSADLFQNFLQQQTDGTPSENLFIPGEAVRSLYQSMNVEPGAGDGLLGFTPDIAQQLRQADATGGDVVIPTADYITHLAGTDVSQRLMPDIRVRQDGMSLNEAAQFNDAQQQALQARAQAENAQTAIDAAQQSPVQQVHDDVFSQARRAGFGPDVAQQYAALYAARYEARADRLGADPLDLYRSENLTIQQDLPESLRALPADGLDAMLANLRSNRRGPTDSALYGPSMMEFLARRGGVEDRGGDLAAMGADTWHRGKPGMPKFIRPHEDAGPALPGMGSGKGAVRFGEDDAALAAHEAGYLPGAERPTIDALHAAIQSEISGRPVYSEQNANPNAQMWAAAHADLADTLDRLGIDPKRASNAEIKAALAQGEPIDGRGFEQGNEPVSRLTGEEIAPSEADLPTLRSAARDYYANTLRGTSVRSDALGKDVEFRGSRKAFSASANPDKLRLFAALPDIIAHGHLDNTADPRNPASEPTSKAYHFLTATVEMDGRPVRVGVTVREDANGNLYYNHSPIEEGASAISGPLDTARKAGPGTGDGGADGTDPKPAGTRLEDGPGTKDGSTTYSQKVGMPPDDVNMTLGQPDGSTMAGMGQARGRIDFGEAQTVIRLFAKRDLSTLLHETGHQWLDELTRDASSPDAPEQLRDDMASVMKWLGVDSPDAIGTDQHEQFARGVEAYLMEGKAPSAALEGAFARFKSWLLAIYRSVAGLRVELSPEIRQVMDRLVATDDQIRQTEASAGLERLFKTAAEAGMTDREFEAYNQAADGARDKADRTLLAKTMADIRRQRTAEWREQAARMRNDVAPMVDSRPDMRALELLRNGKPRDAEGDAQNLRLSKADLEQMFGPGVTDALPRSVPPIFTEKGGVHPDVVAEMAGYRSGDEMVRGLMSLGEQQRQLRERGEKRGLRAYTIDEEVRERMQERHGDPLADGSIEEEALAALHSDQSMKLLATEIRALSRQETANVNGRRVLTGDVTPIEVARRWAARAIGYKQVREATSVSLYARAESKASKAAERALLDGDRAEALRQKQAQMLNHALFIEAKRAADDVDKAQRMLTRYANADTLRGMDQGALDQIHALLEKLDFGKASAREVARRQSLAAWVDGQRAQGLEPAVPARLMDDAFRQHYSTMSVNDVRGLSDAVQSIAHLGRLKQKLLDAQDERDFDALVQEAVDTAGRQPQRAEPSTRRNPGQGGTGLDRLSAKLGSVGTALRSLDASMLKMEQVIQWLDGGDSNGVFNRVVFRRLSDAQVREHDMQADIAKKLRALNDAVPKQARAELDRLREVPELPDSRTGKPSSMTKGELLAVALNMGNEGNLSKMLEGEDWTLDQVRSAMDRHLGKADWDFVQGIWDTIEGLWPDIAALEKRVSGVEPEKVERTPVETPHGTYEGGYYPVVYDPLRSFDVEQNRQRSGAQLFENNYVRATTSQGHTISRVDDYARPLHLSLDVLPRHLNQVIHDLAYREAVMDADRFLAAPKVRQAIEGALGREYYQQFRPWLQSIANDRTIDPRGLAWWDKVAHTARTNATMVGLGFRLSTMVVHGISAGLNSLGEAGVRPMTQAVGTFMRDPKGTKDFVFEKSGEMRNRMNEVDRDMRDVLREMGGDHGALATVRRFSMQGVAMLDMASALPTWLASYTDALKGGMDDASAVYAADQTVRNAHGAGGAKDTAAIQRGSETQKLFTMFYTFWNHLYNRQRDLVRDATQIRSVGDFGSVLARSFFYLIAPPIIHGLVAGGNAKDDDGEGPGWAAWAAEHIGLGLVSGVPVVRDVASAIGTGREYSMSPAAEGVTKGLQLGKDVGRALGMIDGDPSDRWVRHAIETPGYFLGLPTGQAAGAGQFLWDVWHGDEDPEGVSQWARGMMYGPAPKTGR
jgi:hypothetical protein